MALESKPLFHPEVIRRQVRAFNLPERVADSQPKLQHWAGLTASGRADDFKEAALLPDFLTDIFCGFLGYTGPAGSADTFTFSRERHVEVDGKVADGVLGRFQKDKAQFVAVLEGKGARDPLERPSRGGACPRWTRRIATPSIYRARGPAHPAVPRERIHRPGENATFHPEATESCLVLRLLRRRRSLHFRPPSPCFRHS